MSDPVEVGLQVVAILGEPAAREHLGVLTCSPQDRAEVIGRLFDRETTTVQAEALIDAEADDLARAQLVEDLQQVLG